MFDLKTNAMIWELFMSTKMKSAIHFGLEHNQKLIACQNTNFEGTKTLFVTSLRLIAENSLEVLNLPTTTYDFFPWIGMILFHNQVISWAKAKVHVYSDSLLCLGRTSHPFRSKHEVERTDSVSPKIQRVRRIVWN